MCLLSSTTLVGLLVLINPRQSKTVREVILLFPFSLYREIRKSQQLTENVWIPLSASKSKGIFQTIIPASLHAEET